MEIITINLTAGVTQQFRRGGVGLEILSSTAAVDINTYSAQGGQNASMSACLGGQFLALKFGGFDIKSATTQSVRVLVLDEGEGGGSRNVALNGSLNIGSMPAPQCDSTHSNPTVNVGVSNILAAKATRQKLLIQNPHATADLWLTEDGATNPAPSVGFKVGPGGNYEPAVIPRGQIRAYSTVAGNVINVIEG